MRADSYAKSLSEKEFKSFWSSIRKTNNAKSAQHANVVGVVLGMIIFLKCGESILNIYIIQ
jgi:hypothetical protein